MLYGGRVAEEIVFGDITTGASDDIRKASDLARRMIAQYGMSDRLGAIVSTASAMVRGAGHAGCCRRRLSRPPRW